MTSSQLDEVLADRRLVPTARAVLLLRTCLLAQALRPDIMERYWEELKGLAGDLPEDQKESFEGLRETIEPPEPPSLEGFVGEIAEAVEAAKRAAGREEVVAALAECEQRVSHRHWPRGKKEAWELLIHAWMDVDRTRALGDLHHLRRATQQNFLIRENDRSAMTAAEWELVQEEAGRAARAAVAVLLDRENPSLNLPDALAAAVAEELLKAMFTGGADDRSAEKARETAGTRYEKLIAATVEASPELAERLIERWFEVTAQTKFHAETWMPRLFALLHIVTVWCAYPSLEPRLTGYISEHAPAYLRDPMLAHAAALGVSTPDEAESAWGALESRLGGDRAHAEHWYLLTLMRAGLAEKALEMAARLPSADRVVPCLRRAWLYENSEAARPTLRPEDVAGDTIDEFLLCDATTRVEWLRTRTDSGDSAIPSVMWRAFNALDLVQGLEGTSTGAGGAAVGSWYSKNEPQANQFAVFVHINGYGQHLYEKLDPILLATLVAWDESHPDEVARVTRRMWTTMRDAIVPVIRLDLLRNDIFERCRNVLGAHPETAQEYVRWVREELVERSVQERVGDTTYTFQLTGQAPFLFALLAAQNVARVSPRRCDAILEYALAHETGTGDLVTAAAELYASDKGLSALEPPVTLKQPDLLDAWQLGVVDIALKEVLAGLLVQQAAGERAAGEPSPVVPGLVGPWGTLGVRFDIDKAGGGAYGFECWKIFWRAVNRQDVSPAALREGDTAATLAGRENVFCIAIEGEQRVRDAVRRALEQSSEYSAVAASPPFVEGDDLAQEPLPPAGRLDATGNLVDGTWSQTALESVTSEQTV